MLPETNLLAGSLKIARRMAKIKFMCVQARLCGYVSVVVAVHAAAPLNESTVDRAEAK